MSWRLFLQIVMLLVITGQIVYVVINGDKGEKK